jgi:uncharacterized glyoxalase superfamily protein PhnB
VPTRVNIAEKHFMKLPPSHQAVMPYLILKGAAKFIDYARNVFNATESARHLTEDHQIMHAEILIGGSTIMIGDSSGQWKARPASLYIYAENVDATYEKAIRNGGTTLMPPEDKPYGRTCGVEDPFGNVWWITSIPK